MPLSTKQKTEIETLLKDALRKKFNNYNPESEVKPFHTRLLGQDRMALYSFIQSLNTSLGTSIFEQVAILIAKRNFADAEHQRKPPVIITDVAQREVESIVNDLLSAASEPNKGDEIKRIRKVCQQGKEQEIKLTVIDVYLRDNKNNIFYFDIKTAKPNKSDFENMKRRLLRWTAATLYENPSANISTRIAIPYNPYEPKPYKRWTAKGMLDLEKELMVGDEFWNFLGGGDVYEDLLECFEKVGKEMRKEIDEYFSKFN